MKIPFAIGSKLFFRVVFPGSILTVAALPLVEKFLELSGFTLSIEILASILVFLFGWLFIVLDMPIYMLLEGRRYWPSYIKAEFIHSKQVRISKLKAEREELATRLQGNGLSDLQKGIMRIKMLELEVELAKHTIDPEEGTHYAVWPTRLGNIIYAYEEYPRVKYGLDAVFFWPRLWLSIDKDLREEIDNQQAQVDGLVYAVVALFISALLVFGYRAIEALEWVQLKYTPSPAYSLGIGLLLIIFSCLLYRASLNSHVHFGAFYASVFDQYRDKIEADKILDIVTNRTGKTELKTQNELGRNMNVWRYLRWHRVRLPGEARNRIVNSRNFPEPLPETPAPEGDPAQKAE
ncbi:MAG: hypothetical protein MI743_02720 [Sneathiellales bacterium]|nr:hypothetical protein [Sneathiellales bacterium]